MGLLLVWGVAAPAQAPQSAPPAGSGTGAAVIGGDAPSALPILKDRPDSTEDAQQGALGEPFQSAAAGISLRPPAGGNEITRAGTDTVLERVDEQKQWMFKVSQIALGRPMPLRPYQDPETGQQQDGLLALTLAQRRQSLGDIQVLRQEFMPLPSLGPGAAVGEAGVLAYRSSTGKTPTLTQEALVRSSERVYFLIEYVTQAGSGAGGAAAAQTATTTFNQILNSVRLMDRVAVRLDQEQRLFETRSLYVNLSADRLKKAIVAEQWLRLLRDGKDIGYTYVVQEPSNRGLKDGLLVGMRAFTAPEAGTQVAGETWLFCSFDRRMEAWTNTAVIQNKSGASEVNEVGSTEASVTTVLDPNAPPSKDDAMQPRARQREVYHLNVRTWSNTTTAKPFDRDLPPWYLPQALGQMLPRLLPLNEPRNYLFASYVSDKQQVMLRYVDVEPMRNVVLNGQTVLAVPIEDRIGLEGPPTYHYMSPEGSYLGSENKQSGITVLPADAATLRRLWPNANLSRPKPMQDVPEPSNPGALLH
jgi:hypothetical protein